MFLAQDRKWFFGQGSYVEGENPVQMYCIGSKMGEKFPKCIAEIFY